MIGDPKNLMKPPYRVHFFEFEKFDTESVINDPENTLTPGSKFLKWATLKSMVSVFIGKYGFQSVWR